MKTCKIIFRAIMNCQIHIFLEPIVGKPTTGKLDFTAQIRSGYTVDKVESGIAQFQVWTFDNGVTDVSTHGHRNIAVLMESFFKNQKCFFVLFFTVVFFFSWKSVFQCFFSSKCVFFFYNDGKNYCLYCNLLQFSCRSKLFCLALLSILTHTNIMITLVIIYHYCISKCGKEA